MIAHPSPYTPGQTTSYLPGREALLAQMEERAYHVSSRGELAPRVRVFVGGRGVGKTSLLRRGQAIADDMGLTTVWITAGDSDLMGALCGQLDALSRSWPDTIRKEVANLIGSVQLSIKVVGIEVSTKGLAGSAQDASAPGAAVEKLLAHTARHVRQHDGKGLAIFVDELQSADLPGLRALTHAWQHLQSAGEPVPALLVCAGLGHTSDVVTEAASFAERFEYRRLHDLEREASIQALVAPARRHGVDWSPEALDVALEHASGYPYFLQLWGQAVWEAAGYPAPGSTLTLLAARAAMPDVDEQMETFYRTRWGKATPAERDLLRAIAQQPTSQPRRADVARSMGRPTTAISMARRSLMDKGIIDSPARGLLALTAPGFGPWILDYDGNDE